MPSRATPLHRASSTSLSYECRGGGPESTPFNKRRILRYGTHPYMSYFLTQDRDSNDSAARRADGRTGMQPHAALDPVMMWSHNTNKVGD